MGKQFPLVYNKDKVHNDLTTKILFQNYTESTKGASYSSSNPTNTQLLLTLFHLSSAVDSNVSPVHSTLIKYLRDWWSVIPFQW